LANHVIGDGRFEGHPFDRFVNLAHYDLLGFAPRVTSATLLMAGAPGTLLDGSALRPLATALPGPASVYESQQSLYKDGLHSERWMAEQCGITDVQSILPQAWQDATHS